MQIKFAVDTNPADGMGEEYVFTAEHDNLDETDLNRVKDSLNAAVSAQQNEERVPVKFTVTGGGDHTEQVVELELRHVDVGDIVQAVQNTMQARREVAADKPPQS